MDASGLGAGQPHDRSDPLAEPRCRAADPDGDIAVFVLDQQPDPA
jgi:hypothetical protein